MKFDFPHYFDKMSDWVSDQQAVHFLVIILTMILLKIAMLLGEFGVNLGPVLAVAAWLAWPFDLALNNEEGMCLFSNERENFAWRCRKITKLNTAKFYQFLLL